MFGYIQPVRSELKLRELNEFRLFYCGVCTSLTKQCYLAKFFLTYDSVFLSILLSGISDSSLKRRRRFCFLTVKPICFYEGEPIDFASRAFATLLRYKISDDVRDRGSVGRRLLTNLINHCRFPLECELNDELERRFARFWELESSQTSELDDLASEFGRIAQIFFTCKVRDEDTQLVLGHLGFHLGRWLYILDAFDDLERDLRLGNFNPLLKLARMGEHADVAKLKSTLKSYVQPLLFNEIDEVIKAYDLLIIYRFKSILDNIVYLGLNWKTNLVLEKPSGDRARLCVRSS